MPGWLKAWRRRRALRRGLLGSGLWQDTVRRSAAACRLSGVDRERLRELASLFLWEKSIEAAGGLQLEEAMGARVACEACIPVLNLGLELYEGWHTIVLYPDEFVSRHEYTDEAGVTHAGREVRLGESWARGPVILSWLDVDRPQPGQNVVIHEMAHKLDLLDGSVNGRPPLHTGMVQAQWTDAFSRAFDVHRKQVAAGRDTSIDPYGAQDPGEFFAVACEVFFETPALLRGHWPDVYRQLEAYFRQHPL